MTIDRFERFIDLQSTPKQATTTKPRTTARPTQTTARPTQTPRPTSPPGPITCYFCSQCPIPFTSNSPYVSKSISSNRWCAKMSLSSDPMISATRGSDTGVCAQYGYNGCTWRTINGVRTYLCCCQRSYCNTANSILKLNFSILFSSLLILFISKIF